jgi:hypothetical protein
VCTAVGPDNCPFIVNPAQVNGDAYAAGDDCQCGDVTGDAVCAVEDLAILDRAVSGAAVDLVYGCPAYTGP